MDNGRDRPRRRSWLRRFLTGFLATVGFFSLLLVLGVAGGIWWLSRQEEPLPDQMFLSLDLRRPILEGQPSWMAGWLSDQEEYRLLDLVEALDRAAGDPRVKAVYARIDETPRGFATTQELRSAILELRAAGKRTVAYADSLGELSPANEGYYLASAFDQIVLQPVGSLGLAGLSMQEPFAQGLLEKLGIRFEVTRRSEYKTAFDVAAASEPSPEHREMSQALLDSLDRQFRTGIESGRPSLAGRIGELIDAGPYTGEAALAAGLIDRIAHEDEVLNGLYGGSASGSVVGPARWRRVAVEDYWVRSHPEGEFPQVAVIHAVGPILRGGGGLQGQTASADDVAGALAAARQDDDVQAVLFRIASPGGSAVASATIGREIDRLKEAGKPVVVSMGDVAGSGGYWIAADADLILAGPATLTGSIGVLAGKPVLQDLWEWLEVNWLTTSRGENAELWTLNRPYTPAEQAKVDGMVDTIYRAFKERVAAGRGLSAEAVEEVARGRVWTGEQALPIGLVDRLGGLADAIAAVKERLGLQPDQEVSLVTLPDPGSDLFRLLGRLRRGLTAVDTLLGGSLGVLANGPAVMTLPPPAVE
ncbi:signal peptide peptidase SppA [Geminicoccus harenae]|uniref:signal peptide peptidase SppA n=2 Tax=Geminicoccus harenae TaxID=2498453 RepID=UPI001C957B5E|nr:signal peptide peptidase SppA [Geminicoccus harenae]